MTDYLIKTDGTSSGLTLGAAIADTDALEVQQAFVAPASTLHQTFAAVKTWIKAWIVKADVGLGNVANSLQLVAASNLSDLANAQTARANLGVSVVRPLQLTAKYFAPPGIACGGASAAAAASGRLQLVPFIPRRTVTIDRFCTRIGTGSAGNYQAGVYNSHATTLMPTTLVGNGGSGSTLTNSTWPESLLSAGSGSSITLQEGTLYWLGVNVDNTTATFATVSVASGGLAAELIGDATNSNVVPSGGTTLVGYYTAMAFGTWTADITANGFTAIVTSCPFIFWKAV